MISLNTLFISFQHVCSHCAHEKIELEGSEFDRHLISVHGYDYCKLCLLMGPRISVRLHVARYHADKVKKLRPN